MMPGGSALGSRRRSSEPAFRWRSVSLIASSEATSMPLSSAPLDCSGPLRIRAAVQRRRNRRHVRHFANPSHQFAPVLDSVAGLFAASR